MIDPRFPRLEQLYPGLENVPQSWWSEPAAYHSSTVRAVVHQALLWGTPILVEANGAWMTLRPQRIDEKADWTVWGPDGQGEPRRMSGKKISKIALLLPGLNDEIAERYHPEQNLFAL